MMMPHAHARESNCSVVGCVEDRIIYSSRTTTKHMLAITRCCNLNLLKVMKSACCLPAACLLHIYIYMKMNDDSNAARLLRA